MARKQLGTAPSRTVDAATKTYVDSALSAKEDTASKGQPNGYASLDGGGKVPVTQLPNSIMQYQGVWDALTNTPTLANGTGSAGDVYRVSVAGTNLGLTVDVGDYLIYNGASWEKSDTTDAVATVNGYTGNINLTTSDVAEGTNLYYTNSRADARADSRISAAAGVSVQPYSANLAGFAAKTAPTGSVVGTSDAQTLSNKIIQATDGVLVSHATNGNLLAFLAAASGDSHIEIASNISGTAPRVSAVGTAATIPLSLGSKGTGTIFFRANNTANSFSVISGASSGSVNYMSVFQVASGSTPKLTVTNSSDTNVSLNLESKGSGVVQANGIEVVTTTGSQSLTNKVLSSPTLTTPVLGTPSSGTLTNCAGLPVAGIAATGTPSSSTFLRGDGTWASTSGVTTGKAIAMAMIFG